MLSLNSSFYPSHGHNSDDDDHIVRPETGNWGKKHIKSARWARLGKMAAWGPGMDDWEAEQRARKRVLELLPTRHRSRSPPTLPHLGSPSPSMTSPYPAPHAPHLSHSSFVMDEAVTRSFRSRLLDELEEATNGLIEGEATLRRALGRLWQVIGEEGDDEVWKEPMAMAVVPKVEEEEDGEGDEEKARERRIARAPDLTPAMRKVFLGSHVSSGVDGVDDRLEKAIGCLRELEDDGREYVERLDEIREGIGEMRDERNGVWDAVRRASVEEMLAELGKSILSVDKWMGSSLATAMRSLHSLLDDSCAFLDQTTVPPSLREILGAYNTKGDGDRDMLLAVLNAKSAEDQRLASLASLQRTVLELVSVSSRSPDSRSRSLSPSQDRPVAHSQSAPTPRTRPRRSTPTSRTNTSPTLPPRKRPRPSPSTQFAATSKPSHEPDESPSPPSSCADKSQTWSSQESVEYSPRTRTSMTIGSLLSSHRESSQ